MHFSGLRFAVHLSMDDEIFFWQVSSTPFSDLLSVSCIALVKICSSKEQTKQAWLKPVGCELVVQGNTLFFTYIW